MVDDIWSPEERAAWLLPEEREKYVFRQVLEIKRQLERLDYLEAKVDLVLRFLEMIDDLDPGKGLPVRERMGSHERTPGG